MKRFWIVFGLLVVMVGGGFGFCWHAVRNLEERVTVDGGVLVWEVAGSYAEERDDSLMGRVRGSDAMTFSEALFALLRAADDERITALLLDIRSLDADWAKVDEFREAVQRFRERGKPVVAYLEAAGTREYALAATADQVVMAPEGTLLVLGVAAELTFLKDTLGKLGMEADFIHVGAYKSAPERMTRSGASAANREMVTAIVEDRYATIVQGMAEGRGVDEATVRAWVDQGLYDAPRAVAAGLADTSLYFDALLDDRFADDEVTHLADYRLEGGRGRTAKRVALIYVTGVIMPGESRFDNFQGKIAGDETVVDHLQTAGEDDDIDAVILRVDSPGGSALAADLMWAEIRAVRDKKPVVVSMSGMAASGGYYIACLGDSVFADAGTLTGSIGVYAGKLNRRRMYDKIGMNREFITRGENALLLSDEGGFTPSQRELFQGQMDEFYERFLAKVAAGRGLTRDQVHAVAQGRVWTGRQGVERGLVDGLGGLNRALDATKLRLGLETSDRVAVVTYGEELSFFERILLQSLRTGALARLGRDLARGAGPVWGPDGVLASYLEVVPGLRDDGTLAAAALLDGRPVAMSPFFVRLR